MSIIDEQLIGAGTTMNGDRSPFSPAATPDRDDTRFSGFQYAPADLATAFGLVDNNVKVGPNNNEDMSPEGGTMNTYGPVGFRLSNGPDRGNTILGQLAALLVAAQPNWTGTGNEAGKMKANFEASSAVKSLHNMAQGIGGPQASGGYTGGYDRSNKYEVTNWDTAGQTLYSSAATESLAQAYTQIRDNYLGVTRSSIYKHADTENEYQVGDQEGSVVWTEDMVNEAVGYWMADSGTTRTPEEEEFGASTGGITTGLRNILPHVP